MSLSEIACRECRNMCCVRCLFHLIKILSIFSMKSKLFKSRKDLKFEQIFVSTQKVVLCATTQNITRTDTENLLRQITHKTFPQVEEGNSTNDTHSVGPRTVELGDGEGKSFSVHVDTELGQWPPPRHNLRYVLMIFYPKSCKSFQQLSLSIRNPSKHQQTIVAGSSHCLDLWNEIH